jgi:hypothetical protein
MSLSSLLVQRELATIRDVEEALARQVLYGGDLATNLLEVARLDERPLGALLAESFGLPAAAPFELAASSPEARAFVPIDLANEHGIFPLGIEAGALVVAASAPLGPEVEQDLAFASSRPLVVRIAPIFRIYQAISRDYGTPLLRRYTRLLARLGGGADASGAVPRASASDPLLSERSPSVPPAPATVVEPAVLRAYERASAPSLEPAPSPVPAAPSDDAVDSAPPTRRTSYEMPAAVEESRAAREVEESRAAREVEESRAAREVEESRAAREVEESRAVAPHEPVAPRVEAVTVAPRQPEPVREPEAEKAPEELPTLAPSATSTATFIEPGARAHKRPGRRRKGPLTFEIAKREMDEASERDTILDLFFEFSRQFFEYAAFFIVHGDAAEGRDAAGHGALRDVVAGMNVPLDGPSVLASAKAAQVPLFVRPDPSTLDAVLFRDLERQGRSTVGLLPVVVRRRVVAVLVGDDGDAAVEAAAVKDVTSFAALAGAAFERLIVRKKQSERGEKAAPAQRPSVRPDASALGRVLGLGAAPTEALPPVAAEAAPVAAEAAPVAAEAAPVAVEAAPVAVEAAPVATEAAPVAVEAAPVAVEAAPVATEAAPVVEETAESPAGFSLSEPAAPPPGSELVEPVVPTPARVPEVESFAGLVGSDPHDDEPPPSSKRVVEVPRHVAPTPTHELEPEALVESIEPPQSLSVPAHLPPSRSDRPKVLPSVIVDVGNEYMELVDRVIRSSDEASETRLLHAGQHAMPAVLARFPGPVRLDVSALPEGALPRAGECGPVLRLIARQRRVALPFVLTLVDDPHPDRRFWATYLLSELPYVEAIEPAVRALFDGEARVRLAARTAVRVLGELYPTYMVDVLAKVLLEPQQVLVRRVIALQMLGEVRDAAAVPHLLPRLVDPQPEVSAAARASLVVVSRQDFGLHLSHWSDWFEQNKGKQRIEWLIDALAHPASGLRLAALEELVKLTRNAFGYQDDMPKRERERVMQKFRDWWTVEGRARYGR